MVQKIFTFLLINFSALWIGRIFTNAGVLSDWYASLNKAPWTPPGWVFGVAWSSIMICFAIYMAWLIQETNFNKKIVLLFGLQWVLNTGWNPVFFYFHQPLLGLIVILLLTILVGWFLFKNYPRLKTKSVWVLPYFLWLLVATSLNTYIVLMN